MHRRDIRPWGHVESIDEGCRFAVKRVVVDPGAILPVHCHSDRAEHWTVVKGTASTIVDGVAGTLAEGESLHVPMGTMHRLSNRGTSALELIEVRSGAGLGEDDIVEPDDGDGRPEKVDLKKRSRFLAAAECRSSSDVIALPGAH